MQDCTLHCFRTLLVSKRAEKKDERTIPILRQQRDWVGGVRKMENFADVQYSIYADVGWVGHKKSKNVLM